MTISKYSKVLYNETFFKNLKSVLGSPQDFIKSNKKRRKLKFRRLNEKLNVLTNDKHFFSNLDDLEFIKPELDKFRSVFEKELNKPILRKDSGSFSNQLRLSVKLIIDFSYKHEYITEVIPIDDLIKELNADLILYILLNTFLFVTKKESAANKDYQVTYGEVQKQAVMYKFISNLLTHIVVHIMDKYHASLKKVDLYHEIPLIMLKSCPNKSNHCLFKVSHQLINIFTSTFKCEKKNKTIVEKWTSTFKKESKKFKKVTIIEVPSNILNGFIHSSFFPQTIEPENDFETIEDEIYFSKKIFNGSSRVILSSLTKKALKISQQKRFTINKNTIELFRKLDSLPYEEISSLNCLPFTPIGHLQFLEKQILELKSVVGEGLMSDINKCYDDFREKKLMAKNLTDLSSLIMQKFNINEQTLNNSKALYSLKREYKHRMKLRVYHNTIIRFAELFEGFPIYFINSYDYRLRMYPWNYLFNRTSGNYKYLIMEPKKTVEAKDIQVMIINYLKNFPKKLLDDFIEVKDNLNRNEMVDWFDINLNLDQIIKDNSFFYYSLLGIEIKNLKKNGYQSGFLLEIDQKSSGAVLLSILFGDSVLAEQTNLTSGKETKDINMFLMKKSIEWFKNKITEQSRNILSSSRNLTKHLFMFYTYNQTPFGRMEKLREYISDEKDVRVIANEYSSFINSVFPAIVQKKAKFTTIIEYYLKATNSFIDLETLDGSLVKWQIFKNVNDGTTSVRVKNPITDSYDNVSVSFSDLKQINVRKMTVGMLPSFIHSIDGAIMRFIILDIYHKHEYIINHLHDSIQFHPTMYDGVRESITNVYTSLAVNDILMSKLLIRLRNNLLEKHKKEFDLLVKDLYNQDFIPFTTNKENFNVDGMFPFE